MRLDVYIFENYKLKSRTYAQQLVKKGQVVVDGKTILTPSFEVDGKNQIDLDLNNEFVSQGGHKLKTAIDHFKIDLKDLNAYDIGCSNGGFSDCMLLEGVKSIVAVDVADCQLEDEIKLNPKVEFRKANARNTADFQSECADFVSTDVSFISLELILPTIFKILKSQGKAVLLVKPQFEVGKKALSKKGIVILEKDRQTALTKIVNFASGIGFKILGWCDAPKMFEGKNREFLLLVEKP